MTEKTMKERLTAVLQALDTLQVSGMNNVKVLAGSMTVLAEVINTPIQEEPAAE